MPPPGAPIEKRSQWDIYPMNFFQTQSLSAQLNFICPMLLGFTVFIFDRYNGRPAFGRAMVLHEIRNPMYPIPRGLQMDAPFDSDTTLVSGFTGVNALMFDSSSSRQIVFPPFLLDMNQRTLPRTKKVVLQCRNGDGGGWHEGC